MAKTSADSLLTVLNDILDFSKIEAGRLELESIPFSVRHCVAAAVNTLEFVAREKGLQLSSGVHPEIPDQLIGDPHRLRQVLLNLINNGLKFTKSGSVRVQAGWRNYAMAWPAFASMSPIPASGFRKISRR